MGIWLGGKYTVLNKGPDSSLMIWQSRVSRGGGGPREKLMATEEAGAKKTAERAASRGEDQDGDAVLWLHRSRCREVALLSKRRLLH